MAVRIIIIAQIIIALWFYLNNNLLRIGKKLLSYHFLWKEIIRIHLNLIKKKIRYLIWVSISLLPFWKTSDLKCMPRTQTQRENLIKISDTWFFGFIYCKLCIHKNSFYSYTIIWLHFIWTFIYSWQDISPITLHERDSSAY